MAGGKLILFLRSVFLQKSHFPVASFRPFARRSPKSMIKWRKTGADRPGESNIMISFKK